MEKRTILALVLSALVLFVWQLYMAENLPPERAVVTAGIEAGKNGPEAPLRTFEESEFFSTEFSETETKKIPTIPAEEINIETEKYVITLTNVGGCIKSIALKEFPQPTTNELCKLIDVEIPAEGIFNMDGLGLHDLSNVRFHTNKRGNEVEFTARLDNGLDLRKRYIFYKSLYHIDLELYIESHSNQTLQTNYKIVAASNIKLGARLEKVYTHVVYSSDGTAGRTRASEKMKFIKGDIGYAGIQDRYFSILTKPSVRTKGIQFKSKKDGNILTAIDVEQFNISSNMTLTHTYQLFVGPTDKELLSEYDLESALSYGMMGGISKALLVALTFFQRIVRNWGVAIILLSICVNVLLFPLSRKSYEAMKKTQELQPLMDKLKQDHKDNPQKQQKEMMELWKKHGVNPLGGCLPMLLQMPFFIALYQALMRSLNLRGANFLWIKDLSMPDAVPLAFSLPIIGNSLNVLPILMAGVMVAQQKVAMGRTKATNEQAKQQQQMMTVMMPVLMLVLLYGVPSGLVLYWLVNMLLTMFEQRAIMRT